MDFLNSLFGRRPLPPAPPSSQTAPVEPRLLEDDQPQTRKPISEAFNSSTSSASFQAPAELPPEAAPRQNKAPVIFAAGLAFTALSLLITRRSVARRQVATKALLNTNSPDHLKAQTAQVSGAMEAIEALNIATINVLSIGTLVTGGALWYFDIASMDDARRKLRGGLGVDGSGRSEAEAEEDFEEWLANVLSRKEAKERRHEYEGEKEERRNEKGRER